MPLPPSVYPDFPIDIEGAQARDPHPNRWNLGLLFGNCNGPRCIKRSGLMKCGACKAVAYCGAEHQKAHRPEHKTSCNSIKRSLESFEREEASLRAHPGDEMTPANPFETLHGRFYLFHHTRPYMRLRFDVMMAYLNIRNTMAVEEALRHALGMLDLNPGDNQGVRGYVPAMYLRLGRDQEAYDFLKCWSDLDAPNFELKDQDAFEDCERLLEDSIDVAHHAALTHLKIRLLLDVKMLDANVKKHSDHSYEKKQQWVLEDAMTDILRKRRDIVDRADYTDLIKELEGQIRHMHQLTTKRNKYYWPAVQNPDRYAAAPITAFSPGSPQEVNLAFRQTWYMWAETPPVIEYVTKLK
ncbi:hypothetical protein F5Y15DRAFT_396040 [Xylariaceae sp. FL0016]|nr:hypothetical protein F5Y15DRAFT_396040 [Xylariaceae sp. FL0016]